MESPEATSIQNMSLDEFATAALHIQASHYTIVAGFVIYCYDITLTLDDEFSLLWTTGGRFVKILYLTNRYLPFVGLLLITYSVSEPLQMANPHIARISDTIVNRCIATFILAQLCQLIEIVVATSIFVIRIYTIYYGHKYAQRFLVTVLLISHITLLTLVVCACINIAETMFYSPILRFCVGTPNHLTGAMYVTPIVVESFIIFMTLAHAVLFGRRQKEMGQTAAAGILRTLYLDGCMYYLLICGLRMGTACVFYFAPETLILLMPYLEYALTSTITSRWFLSFRRALLDTFSAQHDTSGSSFRFTGASIDFGHQRKGSAAEQRSRRTDTFLSSFVPRTLQRNELPEDIRISTKHGSDLNSHP